MQKFQDKKTGEEWNFEDGVDVFSLPGTPVTLSPEIVLKPSDMYDWDGTGWVENPARVLKKAADEALLLLGKSDLVAIRCFKAGVPFPADWVNYSEELRAALRSGATVLPIKPTFPSGA